MTSKTPPSVSLALRTRSISSTIAAEARSSKHRTGEASTSSRSSGPGGGAPSGRETDPIRTTWDSTRMPSSARNALHGHPAATRAAVSLALALHRHQVPVLLLPLRVLDGDGDGASEGPSVPDAGQDLEPVALQLLPAAAAVSVTAPGKLAGHLLRGHGNPGGQSLQYGHEGLPVRFTGREQPQHEPHDR